MPENKPGADALFVLKPKDGNPKEEFKKVMKGFNSGKRTERKQANKRLVEEARRIGFMGILGPRERKALDLRFPEEGEEDITQKECGKYFGVSPTRVQQIEAKALAKLRVASRKSAG
ncbi:MAG: sigma factor-like helix-turn-helix DNA-binding protein [Candidatus Levybacteria bacterium]|nr:sigma factor-like helix-turn-helix DNA-binding protein [Candidatus Levybacteria bacterium]